MLNYMAWIKGYKGDFDEWAQQAGDTAYGSNEGWERIKRVGAIFIDFCECASQVEGC